MIEFFDSPHSSFDNKQKVTMRRPPVHKNQFSYSGKFILFLSACISILSLFIAVSVKKQVERLSNPQHATILGSTSTHRISWKSPYAMLEADGLYITIGNKQFFAENSNINIHSDPGSKDYTTLEATWQENGVEMRMYLYFAADFQRWWVSEIRIYNGQTPGDWLYNLNVQNIITAPLATTYFANVLQLNATDRKENPTVISSIELRNLTIRPFLTQSGVGISCTDSDGGQNYYTKGVAVGLAADEVITTREDFCRGPYAYGDGYDYVVEWFCWKNPNNGREYAINTNEKCIMGCNNGACLKSPITVSPSPFSPRPTSSPSPFPSPTAESNTVSTEQFYNLLKIKLQDKKINLDSMPKRFGVGDGPLYYSTLNTWLNPPDPGRFIGYWSTDMYQGKKIFMSIMINQPYNNKGESVCGNPPKTSSCIYFTDWDGTIDFFSIPRAAALQSLDNLPTTSLSTIQISPTPSSVTPTPNIQVNLLNNSISTAEYTNPSTYPTSTLYPTVIRDTPSIQYSNQPQYTYTTPTLNEQSDTLEYIQPTGEITPAVVNLSPTASKLTLKQKEREPASYPEFYYETVSPTPKQTIIRIIGDSSFFIIDSIKDFLGSLF